MDGFTMTMCRLKLMSKMKRIPASAAEVQAPTTLLGKLAQKFGFKQF